MNKNLLESKRDYLRLAKETGQVMFFLEAKASHLNATSWSMLGVCTLEEQTELYDFYTEWEARRFERTVKND